ncbi:hypothetical protein [Nocardioides sp.]|uniref:hypothetical protein n=1 Tax=Nocardioides sp. TaxID=35761 RepID=UPI002ED48831
MLLTTVVAPLLVRVADQVEKGPEPEDVKAGWVALLVFLGLAVAVVFLAFSLVKQLRKAQAAKDAGVYGDAPVSPEEPRGTD